MSLYRKYRPQKFAAIVGQDHVKRTIANAVAAGTVAHAYLFSGPRGVGKTSIARILAMALNCESRIVNREPSKKKGTTKTSPNSQFAIRNSEPCGECTSCLAIRAGSDLNVMEIDAASNRGIDEIRALKEGIGYAPSVGGKKVYIIDEVHMLTKEAFNALLKTLEEPPAHAHFVLATTELHRVPDTIVSRSQHFAFKRATLAEHRTHLATIVDAEQLQIDDEALQLIAIHADGGFRDALTLLDQVAAQGDKSISADSVRAVLGVAPEAELVELLRSSLAGDAVKVAGSLESFAERGYDAGSMIDALILLLRQALWQVHGVKVAASELVTSFAVDAATHGSPTLVAAIERLIEAKQQLRWSPLPMLPVELALLPIPESRGENREVRIDATVSKPVVSRQRKEVQPVVASKPEPVIRSQEPDQLEETHNSQFTIHNSSPQKHPTSSLENPKEIWKQLLDSIRPKNAALAALLKSAALEGIADGVCTIRVPFSFYADRVKDRKNAGLITETIATLTGMTTTIACTVAGSEGAGTVNHQSSIINHQSVRTQEEVEKDVIEVFGVAEVGLVPSQVEGA